jgi:hypothetical protein
MKNLIYLKTMIHKLFWWDVIALELLLIFHLTLGGKVNVRLIFLHRLREVDLVSFQGGLLLRGKPSAPGNIPSSFTKISSFISVEVVSETSC